MSDTPITYLIWSFEHAMWWGPGKFGYVRNADRAGRYTTVGRGFLTFYGHDATRLFAASTLRGAIDLYLKTGIRANRAYTPSAMARAAGGYTGKAYKPGKASLRQASDDLTQWIEAMKAALPIIHEGEGDR